MGEITKLDKFGQAIISTVKKYNIQTVLEIGSWDGTGSTQCFIEGMEDLDNKRLICLEVLITLLLFIKTLPLLIKKLD